MTDSGLLLDLISRLSPAGQPAASESRREVTDAELQSILGCARVAPSADNAQTWRFVTVRDASLRKRVSERVAPSMAAAVAGASVVMVVCGVRWVVTRARREQPFVMIDVPIAITHILLRAAEMGVSCTWALDCDESGVREVLTIPHDVRVIAVVALGVAAGP